MSNFNVFNAFFLLLICISFTSAAPPLPAVNQTHDTQKPQIAVKAETPVKPNQNPTDSAKKELASPSPTAAIKSPVETVGKSHANIVKFLWLEIRHNKTLLQRFSKSQLLNETMVPFLKKCDTINDTYTYADVSDPELSLCPVYFDNLLRLNETSVADSINSSDLEEFIGKANKTSKFCEDFFVKNVNMSSDHFSYSKELSKAFASDMAKACYYYCLEPTPLGPLRKSGSCAAIAFMGTKLKKTEVVDSGSTSTKNQDEEADPSQQDGEFFFIGF